MVAYFKKNTKKLIFSGILCLLLPMSHFSYAQEKFNLEPAFTQGQVSIIAAILGPQGHLNKDMYQAFWAEVSQTAINKSGGIESYSRNLKRDLYRRIALIHEMWRSAKLSWIAGEDIETPEFTQALKLHQELAKKNNRLAILGARQDIASMMQVILMSSSGGEIERSGREPIMKYNQIELGLESRLGSEIRATTLSEGIWNNKKYFFDYDNLGIRLKSNWPFNEKNPVKHQYGKQEVVVHAISHNIDFNNTLQIECFNWKDSNSNSSQLIKFIINRHNLRLITKPKNGNFKGHQSIFVRAISEDKDMNYNFSMRIVTLTSSHKALVLIARYNSRNENAGRDILDSFEKHLVIKETS